MTQDSWKLIGICGIYCGDCPSYLAPQINDSGEINKRAEKWGFVPMRFAAAVVIRIRSWSAALNARPAFGTAPGSTACVGVSSARIFPAGGWRTSGMFM